MPEGPEIRLAADKVAGAIVGQPTTAVFFAFAALKPYEAQLTGVAVTAVDTYGKAMVTRFANGLAVYSHNQLYGLWRVSQAGTLPDTTRQLRLAIHNAEQSALLYSASEIEVLREGEIDSHPFISRIGPDLLHQTTTVGLIRQRLEDGRFNGRSLTALLLDQQFLAGLGNYLRSEILFVSGLHPSLRPKDCTPAQLDKLAEACHNLTWQSYRHRGITNDLALADTLKAQSHDYPDYRFWVFNREDKPCYQCGTPIVKETLGGRRLYYCPICQGIFRQD